MDFSIIENNLPVTFFYFFYNGLIIITRLKQDSYAKAADAIHSASGSPLKLSEVELRIQLRYPDSLLTLLILHLYSFKKCSVLFFF